MQTIYFDNSATTAPSPAAVEAMLRAMRETWANPSSKHQLGTQAHAELVRARNAMLGAFGIRQGKPENLVFTASGTEADNLAILGCAHKRKSLAGGKLITSDSEHPAVLRPFAKLEEEGFRTAYIPTPKGVFDMERFRTEMTPDTFLVSVMLVNNETGAVNDIRAISDYAKSVNPDCIIHTDAVQGFLKLPFTPEKLGADLISVSSHKIHGPKGVGALYVSPEMVKRRVLSPVNFGGGQEGGLRSGTENIPGIAAFGAAAAEGAKNLAADIASMTAVRSYLADALTSDPAFAGVVLNLPESAQHAPHILSIRLPGIKSETMLNYLSGAGICVSSGSACAAQTGRVSSVLQNFGLTEPQADATLRISLCADNTREEADRFLEVLKSGLAALVRMKRR